MFPNGLPPHSTEPLTDRFMAREDILSLESEIRQCRVCVDAPSGKPLPHEPRPVTVLSSTARVAICGQAPGNRVHQSGVPFTDPSGDRLRDWVGVTSETFYDRDRIAIVPMGFCFPGYDSKGSDLPPRRECGQTWHSRVFAAMPQIELILLVGGSAQKWHLARQEGLPRFKTVTETVRNWREYLEPTEALPNSIKFLPLPHPSWRNTAWLRKNPWFDRELLPVLRELIQAMT